jgi:hypothetical protein
MPTTLSNGIVVPASGTESPDIYGITTRLGTSVNTALGGAWTAYTPTVAGITGTATGKYNRVGKLVTAKIVITASGAGSALITATKPSSSVAGDELAVGTFLASDASAGPARYTGAVLDPGGSGAVYFVAENNVYMGTSGTVPWTWASGDKITATFSYEEA